MSSSHRPRRAFTTAALLAVGIGLFSAGPVAAQPPSDVETARTLFVRAAKLGQEGRWKEARELYQRSYQLKPAPITRYSIGVAQRESGSPLAALASFRAFLDDRVTSETAPYVGPAREAVQQLEGQIAKVKLSFEPRRVEDVTVIIDGHQEALDGSGVLEVEAGTHELSARAPGHRATIARVRLTAGSTETVTLTLFPVAGGGAGVSPFAAPEGGSAAPADSGGSSLALPVVLMSVGAAVTITGVAVGLSGLSQAKNAATRDGSQASAAKGKGIAGDVLGGAGIATAGVGLILLLTRSHEPAAQQHALRPWATGSIAGIEASF